MQSDAAESSPRSGKIPAMQAKPTIDSPGSLDGLDRLPEAISIIGPDGVHLHANAAATAILGDLRAYREGRPVPEASWGARDASGDPLPDERLPTEITRRTGEECSDVEVGVPGAGGDVRWLRVSTRRLSEQGPPFAVVASFADISVARQERDAVEHDRDELARATQLFATAFADAPVGMALVGLDGAWMKVNRSLLELTGYSEDELLALTFQDITHPDDLDADLELLQRLVAGEIERYSMEKRYFTASGSLIWANLSVSLVTAPDGTPEHLISHIEDITERKRLEQSLQRLADHDPLTDLWNRRRFGEELQRQVHRSKRYGEQAALLVLDLDDFKQVNDTLGHKAGDSLLRAVATAMRKRLRSTDSLGRLGGDEFAVLLINTSPDEATTLARQLAETISSNPVHLDDREIVATASIGVAVIDRTVESDESVLVAADAAMYEAKAAARRAGDAQRR
ncbi:MAG: hypothetical protein JWO02_3860 [Solirubrobacterales bacterium]|nr:hypothetical protein [Solirubrobacterales bacterium]